MPLCQNCELLPAGTEPGGPESLEFREKMDELKADLADLQMPWRAQMSGRVCDPFADHLMSRGERDPLAYKAFLNAVVRAAGGYPPTTRIHFLSLVRGALSTAERNGVIRCDSTFLNEPFTLSVSEGYIDIADVISRKMPDDALANCEYEIALMLVEAGFALNHKDLYHRIAPEILNAMYVQSKNPYRTAQGIRDAVVAIKRQQPNAHVIPDNVTALSLHEFFRNDPNSQQIIMEISDL